MKMKRIGTVLSVELSHIIQNRMSDAGIVSESGEGDLIVGYPIDVIDVNLKEARSILLDFKDNPKVLIYDAPKEVSTSNGIRYDDYDFNASESRIKTSSNQ